MRRLLLLLLLPTSLTAQFLDPFQNPPDVDWKQIDTPHYEIVFPAECEGDAQRIANTLEHLYTRVSRTLNVKPGRITLQLSNRTTTANGYVTLGPRYSEWFSTPPQSSLLGSNNWYTLLAMHEMRHVAQFDALNEGFTKGMYYLFGETAWSFLSFWSVPGWVWEGDAVGIETALSRSGRGRMPEFDRDIRTLLLSGERPSYYAAYLGSYKAWYPSIYNLGYLITTHTRRVHGVEKYATIFRRSANWSFFPWAWSMMAESETDRTAAGLYDDTMDELTTLWQTQLDGLPLTHGRRCNAEEKSAWTNYSYPQYLSDGSIAALKMGLADRPTLVRIATDGTEQALCSPALYNEPFSAAGMHLVWAEQVPDLRWGKSDRTVLRLLDAATGVCRTIEGTGTLFCPVLSPDGARITAVDVAADGKTNLVVLDVQTGAILNRLQNPANDMLQPPAWTPDGAGLVYVRIPVTGGKAVSLTRIDGSGTRDLLPLSEEDVSHPKLVGRFLFYASPRSGIDNIYAFDTNTRNTLQVTSLRYGAAGASPSPDGRTLLYSAYSVRGFDIEEMVFDSARGIPVEKIQDRSIRYWEPLVVQEDGTDALTGIPDTQHAVSDYSAWEHAVYLHSWTVLPSENAKEWHLTLASLNTMNTLRVSMGAAYDINEHVGALSADVSYAGLFPILSFGTSTGKRATTYISAMGDTRKEYWNESIARAGILVPLDFSRGIYTARLSLSADVQYRKIRNKSVYELWDANNGVFVPLVYRISLVAGHRWIREIYPRWGQFVDLSLHHTPFSGGDYQGRLVSAQGSFYFPGLAHAQSAWLQCGMEHQEPVNYRFASQMLFPRGYASRFHRTLYKASVNYTLPLWYPDIPVWSLAYFKRIRANAFYEYGEGSGNGSRMKYRSSGIELLADTHWLTLPFSIAVGARAVYLHTEKRWVTEALIAM